MPTFSPEVQRRVRLKYAKRFDLSQLLGEPLTVLVSELPVAKQDLLMQSQDLRAAAKVMKKKDATREEMEEAIAESLGENMLTIQRELIGACLVDERGDRLKPEDVAAFFDLMPTNDAGMKLLEEMMAHVYKGIGSKKKADGDAPTEGPAGEAGK